MGQPRCLGNTAAIAVRKMPSPPPFWDLMVPPAPPLILAGTPDPPLAKCADWVATTDPAGRPAKRETSTMPQWAGSCWYYLRYIDPHNTQR